MECKKRILPSTGNKAQLVLLLIRYSTSKKTTQGKDSSINVPKKTNDDPPIKKNFIKINKVMTRNNGKKKETKKKVNADNKTKGDKKKTVDKIGKEVLLKRPHESIAAADKDKDKHTAKIKNKEKINSENAPAKITMTTRNMKKEAAPTADKDATDKKKKDDDTKVKDNNGTEMVKKMLSKTFSSLISSKHVRKRGYPSLKPGRTSFLLW